MRFPILMTTMMVSALALGTTAHAQEAQTQGEATQQSEMQQAGQGQQMDARELMDKTVIDSSGEELGQVADVVFDPEGQTRMIVVELDGGAPEGEGREISFNFEDVEVTEQGVQVPGTMEQTAELPDWDQEEMIDADWGTLREGGGYYSGGAGPQAEETAE